MARCDRTAASRTPGRGSITSRHWVTGKAEGVSGWVDKASPFRVDLRFLDRCSIGPTVPEVAHGIAVPVPETSVRQEPRPLSGRGYEMGDHATNECSENSPGETSTPTWAMTDAGTPISACRRRSLPRSVLTSHRGYSRSTRWSRGHPFRSLDPTVVEVPAGRWFLAQGRRSHERPRALLARCYSGPIILSLIHI